MNRILLNKLWLVLTGVILSLTSCSQATSLGEEPALKTDDARTVTLSLRAGAEVYAGTHPALDREKQINSVTAYLFSPQGDYVETVPAVAVSVATGEYKVKSTQAGSYQMVLVANHDEVTGLTGKTIDFLDQHLVTVTAGNATHNKFVMRNQGASISIQTYEDGGSDYRGTPILMERLAARFDVNLLATGYQIKSVQLKNTATQSQLYNNNGEGKQLQVGAVTTVNAAEYTAHLYSYENNSTANHTSLEIICSYGGVELKPITVSFPTVKRNHLYMVKITEKPTGIFDPNDPQDRSDLLNVNVEVLDWFASTVLSVFKHVIDELIVDYSHPKYNPLSYMAHYNVTSDKKWDISHTIPDDPLYDTRYLLDWADAFRLFKDLQPIDGSVELYKLPNIRESFSVFSNVGYLHFGDRYRTSGTHFNWREHAIVNDEVVSFRSDFLPQTFTIKKLNNGKSVDCCVALRYKAEDSGGLLPYLSAWLYYFSDDEINGLHIYSVNIVDDKTARSVYALDENWWNQHIDHAVYRFLPAAGVGVLGRRGYYGSYWTSQETSSHYHGYFSGFDYETIIMNSFRIKSQNSSVRLFSQVPLD